MQDTTKDPEKTKAKRKKAKVKISSEDWKVIKSIAVSVNRTSFDIVDPITPEEVAAILLHLALEKLTPTEIKDAL